MPLGYCDEVHRPISSADARWNCDVGFLGGWEPRRERMLHDLAVAGVGLKIWGVYWDFLGDGKWTLRRHLILQQLAGDEPFRIHRDDLLAATYQGGEVYADDYARAVTGSKIGVGFLRRTWPDRHTTRSFEIPACGSLLLADRTDEHLSLFEEGREAEFFDSAEEMVDKASFYGGNASALERVAAGGYQRCQRGGYSYLNRVRQTLDVIRKL
jgi:spore maturation protein CgeB